VYCAVGLTPSSRSLGERAGQKRVIKKADVVEEIKGLQAKTPTVKQEMLSSRHDDVLIR
jgi:hypothetical protein